MFIIISDLHVIIDNFNHYNYGVTGGPGSGKGRIVANLRSMFGVRLISVESLIFQYLPKKVQHSKNITTTKEMARLIRDDPTQLTLGWIMGLLQNLIENDPNQIFVVDLIPNLKWLVKNENLVKECSKEMKMFEEKVRHAVNYYMYQNILHPILIKKVQCTFTTLPNAVRTESQ